MHFMNTLKVLIAVVLMQLVSSCNEQDETSDALVEAQSHLDLAQVYKDQGQFRAAAIEIQNAAQLVPENLDTQIFLAELYMELGDMRSAINALNTALTAAPDNASLKLQLAEAYLFTNQVDSGLALLASLDVSEEQEVQKNWLLGNLQAASGDYQSATSTLVAVLERDSRHVPTLIALAK